MPLVDLGSFLDDDSINLEMSSPAFPNGKVYTIPSPDMETGLYLTAMANLGSRAAKDPKSVTEEELESLSLEGPSEDNFIETVLSKAVVAEMQQDGISWVKITRLSQYAFAYFSMGAAAANKGVESGAFSGKAQGQNRTERRRTKKAKSDRPA